MPLKTLPLEEPSLNLTPMVDIVFNLLLFFMIASQGSDPEKSIEVQLPQVSQGLALTAAPEKRVIQVFRDGRLTLDGDTVTLRELRDRLASAYQQYRETGVVVRAHGSGPFQRVADVLDACGQAGIHQTAIAVRATRDKDLE